MDYFEVDWNHETVYEDGIDWSGEGDDVAPATNEIRPVKPTVYVDGKLRTDLYVVSITDRVNGVPGEALLELHPYLDTSCPITLNKYASDIKYGRRIEIKIGEEYIFMGQVMKRMDQGKSDTVLITAYDDQWLLSLIPIRGCLVYDSKATSGAKTKFLSAYVPRTNPGGYWNCMGGSIGGIVYPIFAPYANWGKSYQALDDDYTTLLEGELGPWTPRRFLKYLCLIATENPMASTMPGTGGPTWRTLYGSARIKWLMSSIDGMVGRDPEANASTDPLDRKMPDMTFRGTKLLKAINDTLDMVGTHCLQLQFSTNGKTQIEFVPKGWSGTISSTNKMVSLRLKRGGNIDTTDSVIDFELNEDASTVAESVLVEGDVVKGEGRLLFDPADHDNKPVQRGWAEGEEQAFRAIVRGKADDDDLWWALIPTKQGEEITDWEYPPEEWELANGEDGKPYAPSGSEAAMALARSLYPTVFRAFRLDAEKMGSLLSGYDSRYASQYLYPRLRYGRPCLPEQLQFIYKDPNGSNDEQNMLVSNYPIRVEIKDPDEDYWYEATDVTITASEDGLIYIDGIAETVLTMSICILGGNGSIDEGFGDLKQMRLNIAIPFDHRVRGIITLADIGEQSLFDPTYNAYGPPLHYVDSPESYREHHQVQSYPFPHVSWLTQDGTESMPITRMVPPGTEANSALAAAKRKLAALRHPLRTSTWILPGIRNEFRAGHWLNNVIMFDATDENDTDYEVNAVIASIKYDFMTNETIIGGLEGTFRR